MQSVNAASLAFIYTGVTNPTPALVFLLIVSFSGPTFAQNSDPNCWADLKHDTLSTLKTASSGYQATPSGMVAKRNLKWELPIAAATGVLIAAVDVPAANHLPSPGVISAAETASNVLLDVELAVPAVAYVSGCAAHRTSARQFGFTGLAGMGFASVNALAMKAAFNRQYPFGGNGNGAFWDGGKSFPSGHAATSWGLASALMAHYPHHPGLKWTLVAVATSTSVLRFVARRHYPSDILVGGTIGYVSGHYMGQQH
jgi:membrane-associated phospholipid phosphatase